LKELNHPNIVKLYDVFHLKGRLYYALEFGPTNLSNLTIHAQDVILEQKHIKCIIKQVMEGISHLHSNWIMHRDLKSENIIINENGVIKLIDFNSAKIYGSPEREHTKNVTTLNTRAPEMFLGSGFYGPPCDIWSLGCIFAELWIRNFIFEGVNEIDIL